jgi:HK97 family phage major capsid protein
VPFQIKFARVTSGTSGGFIGEAQPIKLTRASLETMSLNFAKLAAMIPISTELARFSSPSAASAIGDDVARGLAAASDFLFINPDQAAVANVSPASITYGAPQIQSSGITTSQIVADAKLAMKSLHDAGFPVSQCSWIVSQNVFVHLSTLLSSTGEPVFPDLADGGTWLGGLPLYVSGSVYGSESASEGLIILLHPNSVALASSGTVDVSVSTSAAVELDSAPAGGAQQLVSAWQNDLALVRAVEFINYTRRLEGSVCTIRGVQA